jgi:hypothetical protein
VAITTLIIEGGGGAGFGLEADLTRAKKNGLYNIFLILKVSPDIKTK